MTATLARARGALARKVSWHAEAGFYVTRPDLWTEIVLPNPRVAIEGVRIGPKFVMLDFRDPDGRVVARRARILPLGRTWVVKVRDLKRLPELGQVRAFWFHRTGEARGATRTVFHWYYPGGMTLVHEKLESPPARSAARGSTLRPGQGYMTLFGVPPESPLDLYLACMSQDRVPARLSLVGFGTDGRPAVRSAEVDLPPRGTRLLDVRALLGRHAGALAGPLAVDAREFAVSYYYFVRNRTDGTWQAQHL